MSDTPRQSERPRRPVINVDADPHNANWLRILAQRRQQRRQQQEPQNGKDQSASPDDSSD